MASFETATRGAKKPVRVMVVVPSIFKDTWASRPTSEVAIGLRVPADAEVSAARANAATLATEYHPRPDDDARIDCYNDALFREICALGMCNPNDVSQPYFENQEDDVRSKLTGPGVRYIFDEIEQLAIETSPVHREATDEEIETLGEFIRMGGATDDLPAYKAKRARRLMAYLLDELIGPAEV